MGEIVRCALRNMRRRLSRTLLTVGSITVGMCMVVAVSFVSSTGQAFFQGELERMGVDGVSVSVKESGVGLEQEQLRRLRSLSSVETAMPLTVQIGSGCLRDEAFTTAVCGIDAGATQAISLELLCGRLFCSGDIRGVRRCCVVDEMLAVERYGRRNIVGKTLTLTVGTHTEEYEIVGVTVAGSSVLQNLTGYLPGLVFIPYTALQEMTGYDRFDQVAVRFCAGVPAQQGEREILRTLRRSDRAVTYRTDDLAAQKDKLNGLLSLVSLILTLISGISLLVSGLGIMTIMLVSVGERTKEIGIKKALGASPGRILSEFLTESVVISCAGGGSGLLIGGAAALAGGLLLGVPVTVPGAALLLLLLIEVAVGVVFGVYPACKAAALSPVDAFRSE